MNTIRKFSPLVLVVAIVASLCAFVMNGHWPPKAHAQTMVTDKSAGFQGSLTSGSAATIVTATTISGSGPAVVAPPGTTAASARIHVKHLTLWKTASGTITVLEHPATGSDIVICTVGVLANQPYDVKMGVNEVLGANGYLTAVGSSIKLLVNDNTGTVTAGTTTYSLE